MLSKLKNNNRGVALVEVLIGISLITIVGVFIGVTITQYVATRNIILSDTNKAYLAEEGYEIIRFLRDENWSNISGLSNNTYYYLQVSTSTLSIGGTPELINSKYHRSFKVQSIYRNASGNIVDSSVAGSVLDTDARNLFVYVADENSTTTFEAILTNLP